VIGINLGAFAYAVLSRTVSWLDDVCASCCMASEDESMHSGSEADEVCVCVRVYGWMDGCVCVCVCVCVCDAESFGVMAVV
jgi:hypothetical protein